MAIGRPPSFGNQAAGRTGNVAVSDPPPSYEQSNANANAERIRNMTPGKRNDMVPEMVRGVKSQPYGTKRSFDDMNVDKPLPPLPSVVGKQSSSDMQQAAGKSRGWFGDALHTAAHFVSDKLTPDFLKDTVGNAIDSVHAQKPWQEVVGGVAGDLGQTAINHANILGAAGGSALGGLIGGPPGAVQGGSIGGALGQGIQDAFGKPVRRP